MEMTRNQQQAQDIAAEREKGGERKRGERERGGGGKKEIYFQSKSKSKSYSKSKSKNRIHQAREKNAFKCRIPRMKYLFFIRSREDGGEKVR